MVQIGRAETIDELIERVGAKLDLAVTDNSTPNRGQVVQWLNDGALLLARLLPFERLMGLQFKISISDVGESASIDRDDIIRLTSIRKYGVECTRMTLRELMESSTRLPLLFTSRTPAVAVSGLEGLVRLEFFPTYPGDVECLALRRPTAYQDSGSWAPDEWSLPVELELGVVDYAVVQGKVQDEEPEQAKMLLEAWYQAMGIEIKTDAIGVD